MMPSEYYLVKRELKQFGKSARTMDVDEFSLYSGAKILSKQAYDQAKVGDANGMQEKMGKLVFAMADLRQKLAWFHQLVQLQLLQANQHKKNVIN